MAIIALHSVLKKLGDKSIYNCRRAFMPASMHRVARSNYFSHVEPELTPPPHIGPLKRSFNGARRVSWIPEDDPKLLEPARIAVEEFNALKNAQLQFVRVLMAGEERAVYCRRYYMTLEAVDADVVKVYATKVGVTLSNGLVSPGIFRLVTNDGPGFLNLTGHRGCFEMANREKVRSVIWNMIMKDFDQPCSNATPMDAFDEVTLSTLHKLPYH